MGLTYTVIKKLTRMHVVFTVLWCLPRPGISQLWALSLTSVQQLLTSGCSLRFWVESETDLHGWLIPWEQPGRGMRHGERPKWGGVGARERFVITSGIGEKDKIWLVARGKGWLELWIEIWGVMVTWVMEVGEHYSTHHVCVNIQYDQGWSSIFSSTNSLCSNPLKLENLTVPVVNIFSNWASKHISYN